MKSFHHLRRALAALIFLCAPLAVHAADITVFAAASLSDALRDVEKSYEAKTGHSAAISFAASSALARQIEASQGADIFISADNGWMDYLDKKGLIDRASRKTLLGNHLVLIAPVGSNPVLTIAPHFDLVGALQGGRLSVADPDSVPAGKYAKTALLYLDVWNSVADHLASAENVRVALAYVARGEAPLGIVYSTDALSEPQVHIVGAFPENSHQPIIYPAALIKDAKPVAREFLDYLGTPAARTIFREYGFVIPGDKP
jgi:molybdate transport system substrate-binding protein